MGFWVLGKAMPLLELQDQISHTYGVLEKTRLYMFDLSVLHLNFNVLRFKGLGFRILNGEHTSLEFGRCFLMT